VIQDSSHKKEEDNIGLLKKWQNVNNYLVMKFA
jgi:hypothetical protein